MSVLFGGTGLIMSELCLCSEFPPEPEMVYSSLRTNLSPSHQSTQWCLPAGLELDHIHFKNISYLLISRCFILLKVVLSVILSFILYLLIYKWLLMDYFMIVYYFLFTLCWWFSSHSLLYVLDVAAAVIWFFCRINKRWFHFLFFLFRFVGFA